MVHCKWHNVCMHACKYKLLHALGKLAVYVAICMVITLLMELFSMTPMQ